MNLFHPVSSQLLFDMGFHTYNPKNLFFSLLPYETVEHIYPIDVAGGGQRGHAPPQIFGKYSHFVL